MISHNARGGSLELTVQNKSYSLRVSYKEAEIFVLALSSSLRQYRNANDHVKIQAIREISMNENFI
ncbi:hypothetical protein OWR28_23915 [Chryseobacterium sp. 1B4]